MAKKKFIALAAGGVCVIAALAVVLVVLLRGGGAARPTANAFLDGTTINGVDVSGLDVEGAAAALEQRAQDYLFTLKLGEDSYSATGEMLNLTYNPDTDLQSLLDGQKEDDSQLALTVDDAFQFDLTTFLSQVEVDYDNKTGQAEAQTLAAPAAQPEGTGEAEDAAGEEAQADGESEQAGEETPTDPNAPQNAYLRYDATGATFVIVPDQPGKALDWDAVTEQVRAAVLALEPELELNLDDLREQAQVTAEDPALQAALKEANSYLDLQLTYTFTPDGGSTSSETLSRDTLGSLYYLDEEDMSVQVDEELLGSYVSSLVEKYSVAGKTAKFKTTGGSYININVTEKGQSVDSTALYDDMLQCLQDKTGGTRAAPYTAASDNNDGYWGGNYVEIDLTSQHLWLYKNGECIVSCGVVSGCVANNTRTPTGNFTIFAKDTDRYLNGSNIDGSTYHTWVNYFMPFSGGCGIHDATWRSSFGGTQYLYEGSHGCVGVSLSNAKTIYNNVSVGTHVVVYGGASPDNIPPRTQTVTASIANANLVVGDRTTVSVSSETTPQFSSSNAAVVTVDGSGNVTAVGPGTATITVQCPAGNTYGEASATVTVTVSEPAHVHTFGEWTTTTAPTCTAEGQQTRTCSGCGATETQSIPATGHAWQSDYTVDKAATCEQDGSKSIHCANCGATKDAQPIPATGHQWDGGKVTKEPTDTEDGVMTYTCAACGKTRTEAIPAIGSGSSSGSSSGGDSSGSSSSGDTSSGGAASSSAASSAG